VNFLSSQQDKPKRKKPVSLTGRSRKYLERLGYVVALVERSLDVPRFTGSQERFRNKFDAFGIADLACIHPSFVGTLWVQVTDHKHRQEHLDKMLAAHPTPLILQAKNRIQLHTWKSSKRKGRKLWCLRLQTVTLAEDSELTSAEPGLLASSIQEFWFYENMHELEVF
jgi:hypothetical protein